MDEYEKIETKITEVNEVKIPIVYFSSSGNTKYVAQLIKNGFKSANVEVELIPINSTKIQEFKPEEHEVFGVGAPVYAMSFPPNMIAWVEKLSSAKNNKKFFLFDTNAGLPGPAIKNFKRILEKKNYRFIGALEIVSPTRDSVFELSSFKYLKWSKKNIVKAFRFGIELALILKLGKGVIDWSMDSIPFGPLIAASFKFVEKSFYKYASHLFGFNANKCTSCKTCEKICPAMAIKFDEKPIIDRNKCFLCFSCTRHCPSGAFYLRLMPNAKYFKGPKTIRGYIPPDEVLKNYERKVLS